MGTRRIEALSLARDFDVQRDVPGREREREADDFDDDVPPVALNPRAFPPAGYIPPDAALAKVPESLRRLNVDCPPKKLASGSNNIVLPAVVFAPMTVRVTPRPDKTPLISTEAQEDEWRIVELISTNNLPFEAEITWGNGSGAGASITISVARSTRICIYARSISIRVANLVANTFPFNGDNAVRVNISDGHDNTKNQMDIINRLDTGVGTEEVPIPNFASWFRLELADPTAAGATSFVELISPLGGVMSKTFYADQPSQGTPIGAAVAMLVHADSGYRVVFYLHM